MSLKAASLLALVIGTSVGATDVAQPSAAEAGDAEGLGEITVTAQKRSENIQRTPIAVTAIGADTVKQQAISTFRDLSGRVPGLLAPKRSTAYTTQQYAIRGIGETDTYPEPTVAVYVDDVYLARTVGSLYDTPDLERIEVLRGPQGTLYGRNSSAGAIRFITKEPTADFHVNTSITYGSFENIDLQGRINGAILPDDKLNGAFSVIHHTRDGWQYSIPLQQHVNDLDLWVIRGKLKSKPTDRLTVTLSGDAMWDRSSQSYYTPVNQPNGKVGSGQKTDPDLTWEGQEPYNFTTVYGGSLTVGYEIDDHLTLKSVTAYRNLSGPIYYGNDGVTQIKADSYAAFWQNQKTQEFNLNGEYDRFNFILGLYYFKEYFHNHRLSQAAGSTTDNIGSVSQTNNWLRTTSYSAFGQVNYKITDELTATVGGRWTTDRRRFHNIGKIRTNTPLHAPTDWDYSPERYDALYGPYPITFDATAKPKSFSKFTPKLGLQYQLSRDIFTYLSYSQGFKSGGYDLRAGSEAASVTPYKPQVTTTYEFGLKTKFLDSHVLANLAVYYNDIKDIHVRANCAPPLCATSYSGLINAGDGNTRGAELELSVLPVEGLRIDGTFAYLKTEYDTFTAVLPANLPGRTTLLGLDFPYAPKIQWSVAANYRLPLSSPGDWRIGVDVQHEAKRYGDIYNTEQISIRPQTYVNGTINFTSADEHWNVGLQANNIFNLRRSQFGTYIPTGAGADPFFTAAYNLPRTINLFVKTSF